MKQLGVYVKRNLVRLLLVVQRCSRQTRARHRIRGLSIALASTPGRERRPSCECQRILYKDSRTRLRSHLSPDFFQFESEWCTGVLEWNRSEAQVRAL